MCSFFTHEEIPYNLRKGQVLSLPPARSTYYGTNSVHFRGSLIWNNLPSYIKSSRSVCEFKNNIKNFSVPTVLTENCSHKLKLFMSFGPSIACFKRTVYVLVFFMGNVNMILICFHNFNFNKKTIANQ